MISKSDLDGYRDQIERLSARAGRSVRAFLAGLLGGTDADAIDVAAVRDSVIDALNDILDVYAVAAASAACDFSERHGLPPQTLAEQDRSMIERVVRYQAGKLVEGDIDGFINQICSFASDSVRVAANRQQISMAKKGRGKRRGRGEAPAVRFARVPSGTETCAFCRMLASRGFVYWSRETAGELDHFHRNCDCLVIASNDRDGIEGYDPDREYALWMAFEEIDSDRTLGKAERERLKRETVAGGTSFNTYADPAVEYFGPAAASNGDDLAAMKKRLAAEGVELRRKSVESIAYSPSTTPGRPGQLMYTDDMSWSAWLHENDHYERDKELGFPGLSHYIANIALWDEMEESAYGLEIANAAEHGYNELADRLRDLLDRDKVARRG